MAGRIEFGSEIEVNPEEIESHDFRVSSIRWTGWNYKLDNLALPHGWENEAQKLKQDSRYNNGALLDFLCGDVYKGWNFNWEMKQDEKTGLITEVKINRDQEKSRVYLYTGFGKNGYYLGEDINSLHAAIVYQGFLARYLSSLTNRKFSQAFIEKGDTEYCSQYLNIPEEIIANISPGKPVTNEFLQRQFDLKAANIAGQFGQQVIYNKFDEKGILQIVQIDVGKDCHYAFSDDYNSYCPHNVDSVYEAAALHGICAEFINSLLKRDDLMISSKTSPDHDTIN